MHICHTLRECIKRTLYTSSRFPVRLAHPYYNCARLLCWLLLYEPNNHGAHVSTPALSLAFRMVSGSGREWRTMAPYRPYSAMIVLLPQHFSVFLHLARLFWNHTCKADNTARYTSSAFLTSWRNLSLMSRITRQKSQPTGNADVPRYPITIYLSTNYNSPHISRAAHVQCTTKTF